MEKRSSRRHPIHASTACGHFTASTHGKIFDGKMLNYSSDGMCVESSAEWRYRDGQSECIIKRCRLSETNGRFRNKEMGDQSLLLFSSFQQNFKNSGYIHF